MTRAPKAVTNGPTGTARCGNMSARTSSNHCLRQRAQVCKSSSKQRCPRCQQPIVRRSGPADTNAFESRSGRDQSEPTRCPPLEGNLVRQIDGNRRLHGLLPCEQQDHILHRQRERGSCGLARFSRSATGSGLGLAHYLRSMSPKEFQILTYNILLEGRDDHLAVQINYTQHLISRDFIAKITDGLPFRLSGRIGNKSKDLKSPLRATFEKKVSHTAV
jgi:hypothetical protein